MTSQKQLVWTKLFTSPFWVITAAFGTYFCMYGFRKPYTAALFGSVAGIDDYKFLLIIAQTTGYVVSKWLGIKVVAEIKPHQRIRLLLLLIGFAELMLFLFAVTPAPWNSVFMFFNGLPLGIVFGLVLRFLEGRRNTELLIAGLCTSFIVSDGVSKSVGAMLLEMGVSDTQMPFTAGLLFVPPLLLFSWMLSCVPPPSDRDVENRSERKSMTGLDRRDFFMKYWPGLTGIIIVYLLVTIIRSIRADFAAELWIALGYSHNAGLFTQTELLVSISVIIFSGFAFMIGAHIRAMQFSLLLSALGFVILLIAVVGLQQGISGFAFILLTGLGVYLPYVSIHTTVFERLIAITRERANVGFLMYLVDSVGYTGYIILMLLHSYFPKANSLLTIFITITLIIAVAGIIFTIASSYYFNKKLRTS